MDLRADLRADLGALAELAGSVQSVAEYDREALALLDRRLGFDVGMVIRGEGAGEGAQGLDPAVRRRCGPLWGQFVEDAAEVVAAAARSGGVAVDDAAGAALARARGGHPVPGAHHPHLPRQRARLAARPGPDAGP
jgi:hypothetical protein